MEQQLLKSKFKAGEKIGENPFSVTYRGTTLNNQTPVIIKIYKRGTLSSSLIKAMKQKVRILCQIDHPNIARVMDGDYGWQGFYYVREYVNGRSLGELARGRKFDTEEASQIGIQICSAISSAHEQGLIHGAISPENIIIRNDNTAILTDFLVEGEIKEAQPQKSQYIMENGDFMAPEEIQGGSAKYSSDIYSLALTLYYILSKKDLFGAHDLGLTLKKIKGGLPPLSGVPKYLNDILAHALQPDPIMRFKDIKELSEGLSQKAFLVSKPQAIEVPAPEVMDTPVEKIEPKEVVVAKKERKRSFFLLMVILVAVVAGLIYSLVNSYFMGLK